MTPEKAKYAFNGNSNLPYKNGNGHARGLKPNWIVNGSKRPISSSVEIMLNITAFNLTPCLNWSVPLIELDSRSSRIPSTMLPEGIGVNSVCHPESDFPCLLMHMYLFAVYWYPLK